MIAPKHISEFTPEEYHGFVSAMYGLRTKRGTAKAPSPVPGLTVTRTKTGALSVKRLKKQRAFDYVTMAEIGILAKAHGTGQADLWNMFKKRKFLITKDRMEAEHIYAELQQIPWGDV